MKNITSKEEFVLEGLDYFTVDPVNRRCTNINTKNLDLCQYQPTKTSEGCFIGRYLTKEQAERGDNGDLELSELCQLVPSLNKLGDLLPLRCQVLHDRSINWDNNGLSSEGKEFLSTIIDQFNMDKSLFTKYLN